ncbi:hypothetical protein D9758_006954 [Tetrapyrgos nigripes]|uniref:Transposase family Tnp2 protein n=1 Tax=Tetrapyrgos nigripes TaxID=182062 RepID=A0A8H5LUT0_9AGAR|nr:hypothetical protein D9758_006954 [Tetrapyrgos nigripes]
MSERNAFNHERAAFIAEKGAEAAQEVAEAMDVALLEADDDDNGDLDGNTAIDAIMPRESVPQDVTIPLAEEQVFKSGNDADVIIDDSVPFEDISEMDIPNDSESDEDEREHDRLLDEEHGIDWEKEEAEYSEAGSASDDEFDGIEEEINRGLNADELAMEELLAELEEYEDILSDEELTSLRTFAFKLKSNITNAGFDMLPFVFPREPVKTWKATQHEVAELSGLHPHVYDMCVNSCLAYTGPYTEHMTCQFCGEQRLRPDGKPRKLFVYIPLIPRLIGYYRSPSMIEKLKYRSNIESDGDVIDDVFDSTLYQELLNKSVVVNGETLDHKHFSDRRDIALGFGTDGFAPWRRRKKTCWPLIIFNYNLAPEVRFHREHTLCLGVIPGPKKPKDFDSFGWPFKEELEKLAKGVTAWDAEMRTMFKLFAYLLYLFGDMPAMSMVMRMKGHNGYRPCRMCNIPGVMPPGARTYYLPLDRSMHPDVASDPAAVKSYHPLRLPYRTPAEFQEQAAQVEFAISSRQSEILSREYGIKGISIFSQLSSITFPNSFPHDFMHLVFENNLENLVKHWTGQFKGLDDGFGGYQFAEGVWTAIGAATAASGDLIPSCFGQRPPDVSDDRQALTAESWSFWLQYIGPVVLRGQLPDAVFTHFVQFAKLVGLCLQFEYTKEDIRKIRLGFANWVYKYEELYIQNNASRLSAAPVTLHGLLHIPDHIEQTGPTWASWAFPIERFCGFLSPKFKSRRYPWANISNFILADARLSHVTVTRQLENELRLKRVKTGDIKGQFTHPSYNTCILHPPRKPSSTVTPSLHDKIIIHFTTRFAPSPTPNAVKKCRAEVKKCYDRSRVTRWATVRINFEGGDTIRAASILPYAEDRRDATFVRFDALIDQNARVRNVDIEEQRAVFFGRLQHLFVVDFPAAPTLGLEEPTTFILAGIERCDVLFKDQMGFSYYANLKPLEVLDITTVQCLVGRVIAGPTQWAIIDRSGTLERSYYAPPDTP